jgi:Rho-binding antiterminator
MNTPYQPISCDFHDVLESLATSRSLTRIRFREGNGTLHERIASVQHVFSRAGEEYLVISTGETVRLDRLVDVSGTAPAPC